VNFVQTLIENDDWHDCTKQCVEANLIRLVNKVCGDLESLRHIMAHIKTLREQIVKDTIIATCDEVIDDYYKTHTKAMEFEVLHKLATLKQQAEKGAE